MDTRPTPTSPHAERVGADPRFVTDDSWQRQVAPDVLTAWEAAGSPGWATGMLHLLPDADAFAKTLDGPGALVRRWKVRAERLGHSPDATAAPAA